MKEKHSKLKNLTYSDLKMQNYLKASRVKATQNEIETIFKMRSRMADVKLNFRGKQAQLGEPHSETQVGLQSYFN